MGACYLGSFIGGEAPKWEWLIFWAEVWEKNWYNQKNCGKIYTGELFRNLACNPIRMEIIVTSDKGHRI